MNNSKKVLLADYLMSEAARGSLNIRVRTQILTAYLNSNCQLTYRGGVKWQKANSEFALSGPSFALVRGVLNDFLAFIGVRKPRKKAEARNEEVPLEKLSVVSAKNCEAINSFMLWLENERDYSQQTLLCYRNVMKQYYLYCTEFNQDNCRRFIKSGEVDGLSPKTLNIRATGLEKYGEYLNMPIKLKRYKIPMSLSTENIPSEAEYRRLLAYLKDERKDMYHYLWIRLAATTGARVSELLQFTFENVLDGDVVLKGKGSKYRKFFFSKSVQSEFAAYVKETGAHGLILCSRFGSPLTSRGLNQLLKAWGKRAGIGVDKMHPHAFRHLFAKMYLKRNKDVVELANLMGHESVDTTRLYLQKTDREQRASYNRNVNW